MKLMRSTPSNTSNGDREVARAAAVEQNVHDHHARRDGGEQPRGALPRQTGCDARRRTPTARPGTTAPRQRGSRRDAAAAGRRCSTGRRRGSGPSCRRRSIAHGRSWRSCDCCSSVPANTAHTATATSTANRAGSRRRARRIQNCAKVGVAGPVALLEQQRRDQEPGHDEEHLDAEEAAVHPREPGVVEDHGDHRQRAQPVERRLVAHRRHRRHPRGAHARRSFRRCRRSGCRWLRFPGLRTPRSRRRVEALRAVPSAGWSATVRDRPVHRRTWSPQGWSRRSIRRLAASARIASAVAKSFAARASSSAAARAATSAGTSAAPPSSSPTASAISCTAATSGRGRGVVAGVEQRVGPADRVEQQRHRLGRVEVVVHRRPEPRRARPRSACSRAAAAPTAVRAANASRPASVLTAAPSSSRRS